MDEYKPNSHKARAEERDKKAKSPSGEIKIGEPQGLNAVKNAFIKEDAPTVKRYLIYDVLIPSVKKIVFEFVKNGLSMALWGYKGGDPKVKGDAIIGKYSYSKYYDEGRDRDQPERKSTRSEKPPYDRIFCRTVGKAEEIKDFLYDRIKETQCVSVYELFEEYDEFGVDCSYIYQRWGWTSLDGVEIRLVEDEGIDWYWLKLPKPKPL